MINEPLKCLNIHEFNYRGMIVEISEFDDGIFMYQVFEGQSIVWENYRSLNAAKKAAQMWIDVYQLELEKFHTGN